MFKKILKLIPIGVLFFSTGSYAFSEAEYAKHLAGRGSKYVELYESTAKKYNVPVSILMRMGAMESGYWNSNIINGSEKSKKHAIGIAQFLPRTAKILKINPYSVHESIDGQGKYLRYLYDEFGSWQYAVMAYNWGEGNVRKAINGKRRIPKSVKRYGTIITKEIA